MDHIERILSMTAAGPLLGGLSWRPPSGGRHSMRRLFEARNLAADATHYTLLLSPRTAMYGLYQPRASEEGIRLPKGTLSAAHCFAGMVGAGAPNAALILQLRSGEHRKEDKVYVVVLDDGVPVIDAVTTEMEARNALGSEDRPIWSDDPSAYPDARVIDFDALGQSATKGSRVARIPMNPWPMVAALLFVGAAASSWGYAQKLKREDLAREQLRQQHQNDPTPRYLSALAGQVPSMASRREDILAAVNRMFQQEVQVPGWQMRSTECVAAAQQCSTLWIRRGGTFAELRRAHPTDEVILLTGDGNPVPQLDAARTVRKHSIARTTLIGQGQRLKSLKQSVEDAGETLQVWKTADLMVEIKPPALWPKVDSVPPSFDHAQALVSGSVVVSDVPGPFILEALRTAPAWISWESVRADIGDGDPATRLKFKATGQYYASLR